MRSEIGVEDSLLRRVEVKARKSSFFQTTEEIRPSETRRMAARAARGREVVGGTSDTNGGYGRPGKRSERQQQRTEGMQRRERKKDRPSQETDRVL